MSIRSAPAPANEAESISTSARTFFHAGPCRMEADDASTISLRIIISVRNK